MNPTGASPARPLSHERLATHSVRHRLEWSESKDGIDDRIRLVIRYSYRWAGIDRDTKNRTTPDIEQFEEHL